MNDMVHTPPERPRPPAVRNFLPLNKVATLQDMFDHPQFKSRIAEAVPNHLKPERMLRTFVVAAQKQPQLAQVSPISLLGTFITVAFLGLEPNTPLGEAYIIPFEVTKWVGRGQPRQHVRWDANLIIGYQGYLSLIHRTQQVNPPQCHVVRPGDEFSHQYGSNGHLMHRPGPQASDDPSQYRYAYMYASLRNGGDTWEVLTATDVLAIRDKSQGYQSVARIAEYSLKEGKDPMQDRRVNSAPWIAHPNAMWRKTALRAGQKWLPRSPELNVAASIDENGDSRRVDFSKISEPIDILDGAWEAPPIDADEDVTYSEGEPERPPLQPPPTQPATAPRTAARSKAATTPAAKPPAATTPARAAPPADDGPPPGRFGDEDPFPPQQQQRQAEAPAEEPAGFEQYLFGVDAEPVTDAYTDPVAFARAAAELASTVDADEFDGWMGLNVEGLDAASDMSDEAAGILQKVRKPRALPRHDERQPIIAVPLHQGRNGADWAGWMKAATFAIEKIGAMDLQAWFGAQLETVAGANQTTKINFVRLVKSHSVKLGMGDNVQGLAGLAPTKKPTEPATPERPAEMQETIAQRDERHLSERMADMAAVPDYNGLLAWERNPIVVSLRDRLMVNQRTDLLEQWRLAYKQRAAELRPMLETDQDDSRG